MRWLPIVDDGELLAVVGLAEAPAELLEPQDSRFHGAEHEDGVELGEVEAFVEDVHRADDVELALRQLLHDCARGAEVSPEWTATARRPCCRKKSAMKSAWRCETQKARVRVPPRFWSCRGRFGLGTASRRGG